VIDIQIHQPLIKILISHASNALHTYTIDNSLTLLSVFIKCKVQISIGTQIIRQYIYITQTIGIKQKREREKKGRRKKDTDNAGALIFYIIPLTLNSCHLIDYKIYSKNTLCLIYLFTLFHRQTIQFN